MVEFKNFVILIAMFALLLIVLPNPVQAEKIISVSSGISHTLGLTDDGNVYAWGSNYWGQIGSGTKGDTYKTPYKVPIDNVRAISAGGFDSLALKNDGTVWAWGSGRFGGISDDIKEYSCLPVQVPGLPNIKAVYACSGTNFALSDNGTVWAWGGNNDYEIGDGTNVTRSTPVVVSGLSDVTAIGERGNFVIDEDGTVSAWGNNVIFNYEDTVIAGLLGGQSNDSYWPVPFKVNSLDNAKQITGSDSESLVLKNDGTVWAWGSNYYGQLGDGSIKVSRPPEVKLSAVRAKISMVKKISAMSDHCLALKSDGTVWEWGKYIDGRTIWGSDTGSPSPSMIKGLNNAVDITTGKDFCIVLLADGSVWGWGQNNDDELGDHNKVEASPIKIIDGSPTQAPSATPVSTPATMATPTSVAMPTSASPTPGMGTGMALMAITTVIGAHVVFSVRKMKK